jgi:beta-N-acetylhexosaminidase
MKSGKQPIAELVQQMTVEQKIGALLTLGFAGTMPRRHILDFITKYHCGGLRLSPHSRAFGSYIDPKSGKSLLDFTDNKGYKKNIPPPHVTAGQYQAVLKQLQETALQRQFGLPLHFSYDQEGGTSADFDFGGVNIFPKPMGLRASGDPRLAYEVALAMGRQSRAVGFNWVHSPVLDINVNPANPEIYTRAYSDRVEEVIEYAVETCRGLRDGGLIATGKHFPGRGDSALDAHFEMPTIDVDRATMFRRELLPYKVLIEKGLLPSIMIAHSIYPAFDKKEIATVSKPILTGLLREELGFSGVITTDSMTMGGVAIRYGVANACALALEAGADLVLMKSEGELVEETIAAIRHFIETGRISETELDAKVQRVLSLKYDYDLFDKAIAKEGAAELTIKDPAIINLADRAARCSTLIARDREGVLPLAGRGKTLLIEQVNKCPNDFWWHPGLLLKNCLQYHPELEYLETSYTWDDEDLGNIKRIAPNFDTIIVTNFYTRAKLANNQAITELLLKNTTKRVVVVTNTPYDLSIPEQAGTILLTLATSPANMAAVAGVLFGKIKPEGEWPVANPPQGK